MLDINQYTYQKQPFDLTEKFNIHPLNDEGVKTYYTKEAHTHTFIDKINPREMEKIYKEKQFLDEYMNSVKQERLLKKEKKESKEKNEEQNLINEENDIKEEVFDSLNLRQRPQEQGMSLNNNTYEDRFRSKTSDHFYNDGGYKEYGFGKSIRNNDFQGQGNKRDYNQQNYNSNFNQIGQLSGSNYNNKPNFSNIRFVSPKRLDEKLAAFGNSNFGKNSKKTYLATLQPKINKIKTTSKVKQRYNINEENVYPSDNSFFIRPYKKIGFESYNIPRIQNQQNKIKPIQVNQFEEKCFKSLSGFFNSKKDENFDNYLVRENQRLTEILLSQTSEKFLKTNRLPKISYIVNQPEIVVKRTGIGNSKYMGKTYNPFNFTMNMYKNKTKTNINGALYLH